MKRPVIQILFAAMLGLAVLFAPGPQSAQAAPVAAASLATQVDATPLVQKTWYYYRRHYHRHYYRPHYWHRRHWHRRYYW